MHLAIILVKLIKLQLMVSCEEENKCVSGQVCLQRDGDGLRI